MDIIKHLNFSDDLKWTIKTHGSDARGHALQNACPHLNARGPYCELYVYVLQLFHNFIPDYTTFHVTNIAGEC